MLYFNIHEVFYSFADTTKKCTIYIVNQYNQIITCNAEIALTNDEHEKGLMHRKELCKDCGMLFVFNAEEYRSFWMKNTYIPLSIAYIDANGIINDIQDMKPLQTFPVYSSKYPARYALEVNQGWFKKNSISIGSKVIVNGCISK